MLKMIIFTRFELSNENSDEKKITIHLTEKALLITLDLLSFRPHPRDQRVKVR